MSPEFITLAQILEMAKSNNPEIRAAGKFWDAAGKKAVQAATPEGPRLDFERMYAPNNASVIGAAEEKNVAISQEIPFPTKLYLRAGLASKEAQMAEQKYLAKVREVLSRARAAYAMLYLSHKNLELFNENIELMRRFTKVAESKYIAGRASQSDVLKAQVELTKMLNMLVVIQQEKEVAQAMLNALVGRPATAPLGIPVEPDFKKLSQTPAELEAQALQYRPELKEAALGLERASRSLSLARSEFIPDLMLGYRRRNDMTRGNSHDGVIGFTMPLWFWKPAAMAAEARAEKEMYEAELEFMRLMTTSDVRIAFVRAQAVGRLMELYRTGILPQAQAALNVAEAGYQSERISFLDLVDAQRSLLDFRLEYYQYAADYEERIAQLERVVGREIGGL
ncbi:MAG: TolC family protein [Elusimicrobia bacterium]|nr:TolC family protein [Elusimicrobiota bacterium]